MPLGSTPGVFVIGSRIQYSLAADEPEPASGCGEAREHMPPVVIASKIRFLVPDELESRLLGASVYTKKAAGWSDEARRHGLFFDFSRVEWVDLGALAQVVILIEAAARDGVNVTVALPLVRPRSSEARWMTSNPRWGPAILRRIARRSGALSFLKYIRFADVVMADHVGRFAGRVIVLDDFDSSSEAPDGPEVPEEGRQDGTEGDAEPTHEERLYRYFFPLTWISSAHPETVSGVAAFLGSVVGETERGLDQLDAGTIRNVILHELVQNVINHAGTDWALVAAWARPEYLPPKSWEALPCERPYLEWLNQKRTSIVEVVVADSGRGLPAVLSPAYQAAQAWKLYPNIDFPGETAGVMLWAFDRWSTSRSTAELRGTRGLYRLDRVVKKYEGLLTIRAENHIVGLDHGGRSYDEPVFRDRVLPLVPGTILRLRLPARTEQRARILQRSAEPPVLHSHIIRVGNIQEGGSHEAAFTEIKASLLMPADCVIAVVEAAEYSSPEVERLLRSASELRHPGALVLWFVSGAWSVIENAVDSVNLEHERLARGVEWYRPEHYEIWDPVLIVGPHCEVAWAGATTSVRTVLGRLLDNPVPLPPSEFTRLVQDERERANTIRVLRNDTAICRIGEDGSVTLRLAVVDVLDAVSKYVAGALVAYVSRLCESGKPDRAYRTPTLHQIRCWIRMEELWAGTGLLAVASAVLAAQVRLSTFQASDIAPKLIIGDSSGSSHSLESLRRSLGLVRKEAIAGETGGSPPPELRSADSGDRVIVHCDIIHSSDTVRRSLRQALRDGAVPIAVTCTCDGRLNATEAIEEWGTAVPVFRLCTVGDLLRPGSPSEVIDINPITREPEDRSQTDRHERYRVTPTALRDLVLRTKSLHFGHIGRPIGRHFTFYLDATRLINQVAIADAFESELDAWIGHGSAYVPGRLSESIELWHPEPEPKPSAPAKRFAEAIAARRKDTKRVRSIRREAAYGRWYFSGAEDYSVQYPNVVVVDWGALTGTTITQMIRLAARAGADRILVCIFMCQLPPHEEQFFYALRSLYGTTRRDSNDTAPLLPGLEAFAASRQPVASVSERTTSVTVRFLSQFPLESYDPAECPVCQQLVRLSQESYPTRLLADFAAKQRYDRLRIKSREEILDTDPLDFNLRPLDPSRAVDMIEFRELLVKALGSTAMRQHVLERILALKSPSGSEADLPCASALALVHFLSVEPQWLRRAPLRLSAARTAIAEIALRIAHQVRTDSIDRLNAIIVLRTSSKGTFAHSFAGLFRCCCASDELLEQLLYDVFTYIARPYHQIRTALGPLLKALEEIDADIEAGHVRVSSAIAETVSVLAIRARTEYERAGTRVLRPAEAWSRLRHEFGVKYEAHGAVSEAIMDMQPGIDGADIQTAVAEIEAGKQVSLGESLLSTLRSLEGNWRTCTQFLDYTILPLLAQLQPVLVSEDARRALGPDTVDRLIELLHYWAERRTPVAELEFSRTVTKISRSPERALSRRTWNEYVSESQWFWERLLRAQSETQAPSRLIQFLMTGPVDLRPAITMGIMTIGRQLPSHEVEGLDGLPECRIFCTEELFQDVMRQILLNVRKHAKQGIRSILISVSAHMEGHRVHVSIGNSGSEATAVLGVGLVRLESRLHAFGATLKGEPRPADSRFSYQVDLSFEQGD